mmetsp:Transcript_12639/g.37578  ORF Transcript_12639/g.37578 Transcript_12639/m.37578 type:complete len:323 (+) Transcript_12639:933-1901(+)
MYSKMLSSSNPLRLRRESDSTADLTAMLLSSSSLHNTSPATCFSFRTSFANCAVMLQNVVWSSRVVLGNRLVPTSNWSTTSTGVCFFSIVSSAMTTFIAVSKTSALFPPALPLSNSPRTGTLPASSGGTTWTSACTSSPGTDALKWRKTHKLLRSSSIAILELSPGRGPIVPKIGSIWNCVLQCVMMCSANSILPSPVFPEMTTTPPSAKGLPPGAFDLGAPEEIVKSVLWMALLNGPPSMSCTLVMPDHLPTEHNWINLFLAANGASSTAHTAAPSVGLSYQGKWTFLSRVNPIGTRFCFNIGAKMGIKFVFPLTLMAGIA